jgi:hypothetical protein
MSEVAMSAPPSTSAYAYHLPGTAAMSYGPSAAGNYNPYPTGMMPPSLATADSPESLSPPGTSSGLPGYDPQFAYMYDQRPPSVVQPMASSSRYPQSSPEDEHALRRRIRQLELINESAQLRVRALEREVAHGNSQHALGGLPTPAQTPQTSPSFEASWHARTESRVRQFCSLNRAGNALCAWHETRRERRAFPPRAAPAGTLNCGCTYDEALFEESLARNGVGAYHPGESVRMDPALRNPLLRLLQDRYGYRDGDFERDGTTGAWKEGEGPLYWEQRALLGVTSRRQRGDTQ